MQLHCMSKPKNILAALFVVLLSIQTALAESAFKECTSPLLLSASMDWFPYLYINEEGQSTGSDIELLRLILDELGCDITIAHFPERRSIYEQKKGNFDVGLGASLNKERLARYHFSSQYRNEVNQFAYHSSDVALFNIKKFQDIITLNKKIALNLAGWYGPEIEASKTVNNNYIYTDTVTRRLKMLSFKRVDVVIDDYNVLCSEIARLPEGDLLTINPLIIFETPIYFIFNKDNISQEFVEQFNIVLENMKKDGRLAAHFIEYLPADCRK